MPSVVTLPQARSPLGYVTVAGQRIPVEIDREWMRAFTDIVTRSGGTSGTGTDSILESINDLFSTTRPSDAAAQDAARAVDELRNDLASARGELQAARNRLEQLEDRLA